MAGQGGLNGNLSRFGITNFSDHDLIRVMSQDGPKSSREGQSLFLIDGDLHHPRKLILDRIFDRNQLIFERVHFRNRGIQGCCFSASCRSGHQDHAVGTHDGPPKPFQIFRIESKPFEFQRGYAGRNRFPV